MTDTRTRARNVPAWSQLLLAAVLVSLVGGAFWLKTRPKPAITTVTPSRESTDALLALGVRLHTAKNYDGALEAYRKILEQEPAHPKAHYNIGQIYNVQGRNAEAQREYEAALRSDPTFLDARLNLGVVLYRQGQFSAAAEAFRHVLRTSPRHPLALFNLGISYLALRQADQAIRWLRAALREDPNRADTHYYLGLALERERKVVEARAALERALKLNPTHADAYVALARVYLALGDQRMAAESMRKANELRPLPFPSWSRSSSGRGTGKVKENEVGRGHHE